MSIKQNQHFTLILLLLATSLSAKGQAGQNLDQAAGLELMQEVYKRHQQFAYIYEEQSMVMMDSNGHRDTRKVRRYSRVEHDGSIKYLLLFDSPDEISGVALLANRDTQGVTHKFIYLPAFGEQLIENISSGRDGKFLGTDFSIENLSGEVLDDYVYVRRPDKKSQDIEYFVIDVYQKIDDVDETLLPETAQVNRRHFICKDNYFITRTDYFDARGNVFKKQSQHDLKRVDGKMWRANMILMENIKEQHQTLIKIDRRVFSHDYVAEEIFTADWLFSHYPFVSPPLPDDETYLVEDDDSADTGDEDSETSTNPSTNPDAGYDQ